VNECRKGKDYPSWMSAFQTIHTYTKTPWALQTGETQLVPKNEGRCSNKYLSRSLKEELNSSPYVVESEHGATKST
jgi:hypothetical protein